MATYSGPINTPQDFATAVLTDLGAPVTSNNITTMTNWMAAENAWPPPRNNPLNNGLGSGGGSGLGSYPSLAVAAQYAAENLSANDDGYPAAKAALMANAPEAQFKQAIVNSGWAGGHYQGTDYGAGVPYQGPDASPTGIAANTPAQNAALSAAAAEPGGAAYLSALNAQNQAAGQGVAGGTPSPTAGATPGDTSAAGDAYSTIESQLTQYDLGSLAGWAWGELTAGKNSDQIMLDLQTQPAYEQSVFGQANAARTKAGLAPMTPADILAYQDQAQQFAQSAGLPQGTINQGTIVSLLGNDVSASELNQRLTSGYEAAMNAPAETRTLLNQYYGVNTGALAAYYLDPENAIGTLKNQLVAAEVGTQAQQSGFGQLSGAAATQLSSELAAQGKVNPSGSGQWDVDVGSQFAALAPLAALENPMPGMGAGAQPVTQNQLLAYGFLSKGQQQVQSALETRKAFASGGGGEDVTATGVVGAGAASAEGAVSRQEQS